MPVYEYEHATSAKKCALGDRFELVQSMSENALEACPKCGKAISRVISAPAIHGAGSSNNQLANKNLADKGFTKYVKAGDGFYEKKAGKGPDVIRR